MSETTSILNENSSEHRTYPTPFEKFEDTDLFASILRWLHLKHCVSVTSVSEIVTIHRGGKFEKAIITIDNFGMSEITATNQDLLLSSEELIVERIKRDARPYLNYLIGLGHKNVLEQITLSEPDKKNFTGEMGEMSLPLASRGRDDD